MAKKGELVYITRYALSRGIIRAEVATDCIDPDLIIVRQKLGDGLKSCYFRKGEWAKTEKEAFKQAEKLLNAQVEEEQRKLNRLRESKIEMARELTEEEIEELRNRTQSYRTLMDDIGWTDEDIRIEREEREKL